MITIEIESYLFISIITDVQYYRKVTFYIFYYQHNDKYMKIKNLDDKILKILEV